MNTRKAVLGSWNSLWKYTAQTQTWRRGCTEVQRQQSVMDTRNTRFKLIQIGSSKKTLAQIGSRKNGSRKKCSRKHAQVEKNAQVRTHGAFAAERWPAACHRFKFAQIQNVQVKLVQFGSYQKCRSCTTHTIGHRFVAYIYIYIY